MNFNMLMLIHENSRFSKLISNAGNYKLKIGLRPTILTINHPNVKTNQSKRSTNKNENQIGYKLQQAIDILIRSKTS